MTAGMMVLLVCSNDQALRSAFEQFRDATQRMGAPGLPFQQRLKITTAAQEGAKQVEQRIQGLRGNPGHSIQALSASLFDAIPDTAVRNVLMNGLYTPEEFASMVDRNRQLLPGQLLELYQPLRQAAGVGEYLLFWNTGEAEARAILSGQGD